MIHHRVKYLVLPIMPNGQLCVWEFNMEKHDMTPLFDLGISIGTLMRKIELSLNTEFAASSTRRSFQSFIKHYSEYKELILSLEAAEYVISCLEDYRQRFKDQQPTLDNDSVTTDQHPPLITKNILTNAINDFQTIIAAEIPKLNIFYVQQHRDRDMNLLINSGECALSQKTLDALSISSKTDVIREIREAARCLAFDVPTSVGLHLCRAVEIVVTKEYFPVLSILVPQNRNLGRYIKVLEKNNNVSPKVISKLNDFKDYYRNRITHPEEFWDIDNADSAFGTAINVIDAIVKDIQEIKKKIP